MRKISIIVVLVLLLVLIGGSVASAQTKISLGINSPLGVGFIGEYSFFYLNSAPFLITIFDFSAYEMVSPNFGFGLRYLTLWGIIGALTPSAIFEYENDGFILSTQISGGLILVTDLTYRSFFTAYPGFIVDQGFLFKLGEYYQIGASIILAFHYEMFYYFELPIILNFVMRWIF
jgi:hypothetical protein